MYFLSTYLAGQFELMTRARPLPEPDERAEELGDFCMYCGGGLAEHDHYCRGCGGSLSIVSIRRHTEEAHERKSGTAKPPEEITDAGADDGFSIPDIVVAAESGSMERVRALIPGDVNATNAFGETALMWAVRCDHQRIVELLLQNGANPNLRTSDAPNGLRLRVGFWVQRERAPGQTALIWAAGVENAALVELLLAYSADPNVADDWRQTPLLWAALEQNVGAARLLIAAGADVNHVDDVGRTPIFGSRAL